jgi:peptidoglycan/LPS O-acetylase OafA/YrhL
VAILRWLGCGLFGSPDINGISTLTINCGVTWTLQYEWIFYLVLPLLVAFGRPPLFAMLVTGFLIVTLVLKRLGYESGYQAAIVALPFVGGMLAAYAVRFTSSRKFPASPVMSCFVAASFICGALAYTPGHFSIVAVALFPAFCAIALGNDIFGLLKWRSVRFLGEISFSVYLLHGILLLAALRAINEFTPVARLSDLTFGAVCAALSVAVVTLSAVTFVLVEKRFMSPAPSAHG